MAKSGKISVDKYDGMPLFHTEREYGEFYRYVKALNDIVNKTGGYETVRAAISSDPNFAGPRGMTIQSINDSIVRNKYQTYLNLGGMNATTLNKYGNYAAELARVKGKPSGVPSLEDVDALRAEYHKVLDDRDKKIREMHDTNYDLVYGVGDKPGFKKEMKQNRAAQAKQIFQLLGASVLALGGLSLFGGAAVNVVSAGLTTGVGLAAAGPVVAMMSVAIIAPWAITKFINFAGEKWAKFVSAREKKKEAKKAMKEAKKAMKMAKKQLKNFNKERRADAEYSYPGMVLESALESSADLERVLSRGSEKGSDEAPKVEGAKHEKVYEAEAPKVDGAKHKEVHEAEAPKVEGAKHEESKDDEELEDEAPKKKDAEHKASEDEEELKIYSDADFVLDDFISLDLSDAEKTVYKSVVGKSSKEVEKELNKAVKKGDIDKSKKEKIKKALKEREEVYSKFSKHEKTRAAELAIIDDLEDKMKRKGSYDLEKLSEAVVLGDSTDVEKLTEAVATGGELDIILDKAADTLEETEVEFVAEHGTTIDKAVNAILDSVKGENRSAMLHKHRPVAEAMIRRELLKRLKERGKFEAYINSKDTGAIDGILSAYVIEHVDKELRFTKGGEDFISHVAEIANNIFKAVKKDEVEKRVAGEITREKFRTIEAGEEERVKEKIAKMVCEKLQEDCGITIDYRDVKGALGKTLKTEEIHAEREGEAETLELEDGKIDEVISDAVGKIDSEKADKADKKEVVEIINRELNNIYTTLESGGKKLKKEDKETLAKKLAEQFASELDLVVSGDSITLKEELHEEIHKESSPKEVKVEDAEETVDREDIIEKACKAVVDAFENSESTDETEIKNKINAAITSVRKMVEKALKLKEGESLSKDDLDQIALVLRDYDLFEKFTKVELSKIKRDDAGLVTSLSVKVKEEEAEVKAEREAEEVDTFKETVDREDIIEKACRAVVDDFEDSESTDETEIKNKINEAITSVQETVKKALKLKEGESLSKDDLDQIVAVLDACGLFKKFTKVELSEIEHDDAGLVASLSVKVKEEEAKVEAEDAEDVLDSDSGDTSAPPSEKEGKKKSSETIVVDLETIKGAVEKLLNKDKVKVKVKEKKELNRKDLVDICKNAIDAFFLGKKIANAEEVKNKIVEEIINQVRDKLPKDLKDVKSEDILSEINKEVKAESDFVTYTIEYKGSSLQISLPRDVVKQIEEVSSKNSDGTINWKEIKGLCEDRKFDEAIQTALNEVGYNNNEETRNFIKTALGSKVIDEAGVIQIPPQITKVESDSGLLSVVVDTNNSAGGTGDVSTGDSSGDGAAAEDRKTAPVTTDIATVSVLAVIKTTASKLDEALKDKKAENLKEKLSKGVNIKKEIRDKETGKIKVVEGLVYNGKRAEEIKAKIKKDGLAEFKAKTIVTVKDEAGNEQTKKVTIEEKKKLQEADKLVSAKKIYRVKPGAKFAVTAIDSKKIEETLDVSGVYKETLAGKSGETKQVKIDALKSAVSSLAAQNENISVSKIAEQILTYALKTANSVYGKYKKPIMIADIIPDELQERFAEEMAKKEEENKDKPKSIDEVVEEAMRTHIMGTGNQSKADRKENHNKALEKINASFEDEETRSKAIDKLNQEISNTYIKAYSFITKASREKEADLGQSTDDMIKDIMGKDDAEERLQKMLENAKGEFKTKIEEAIKEIGELKLKKSFEALKLTDGQKETLIKAFKDSQRSFDESEIITQIVNDLASKHPDIEKDHIEQFVNNQYIVLGSEAVDKELNNKDIENNSDEITSETNEDDTVEEDKRRDREHVEQLVDARIKEGAKYSDLLEKNKEAFINYLLDMFYHEGAELDLEDEQCFIKEIINHELTDAYLSAESLDDYSTLRERTKEVGDDYSDIFTEEEIQKDIKLIDDSIYSRLSDRIISAESEEELADIEKDIDTYVSNDKNKQNLKNYIDEKREDLGRRIAKTEGQTKAEGETSKADDHQYIEDKSEQLLRVKKPQPAVKAKTEKELEEIAGVCANISDDKEREKQLSSYELSEEELRKVEEMIKEKRGPQPGDE